MTEKIVLALEDLRTHIDTPDGAVRAVDGVSFTLGQGETLGIVGESGSGKTMTCLSILNLLPPNACIVGGRVLFAGRDLVGLGSRELRAIRGAQISMVFQDPMTSLSPFLTVGEQVMEPLLVHGRTSAREARDRALEMLRKVGIPEPALRMRDYPHHLSGGMRQRVMVAMALIANPKVLIADEPTTALDATIQAQVLELFREIKHSFGASIILITHNLGIVAGLADRVAVMYAGRIVEYGSVDDVFYKTRHPYTLALLRAVPRLGVLDAGLEPIAGAPPNLAQLPPGCSFYERCSYREDRCRAQAPPLVPGPARNTGPEHAAACWVEVRK